MTGLDPDGELLARVRTGERSAFDELMHRYEGPVYSYARHLLRDDAWAAETTQEIFMRAFRYCSSFQPGAGSVRAWLFAIAANRIRDVRAARRKAPAQLDDGDAVPAREESEVDPRVERLREAVARLEPSLREVVALRYLSDLPYEDVGRALGISAAAARMRALRGRDALAVELRALGGEA